MNVELVRSLCKLVDLSGGDIHNINTEIAYALVGKTAADCQSLVRKPSFRQQYREYSKARRRKERRRKARLGVVAATHIASPDASLAAKRERLDEYLIRQLQQQPIEQQSKGAAAGGTEAGQEEDRIRRCMVLDLLLKKQ